MDCCCKLIANCLRILDVNIIVCTIVFQILRLVFMLYGNDDTFLSYLSVVLNCVDSLLYLAVCMLF